MSRIGPGFVSEDEADVLRHDAFPFLDPSRPAGEAADSSKEFDLYPPRILMKGDGPFVISRRSQRDILSKLSRKSIWYIWGGPIWALWAVWELLSNPGICVAFVQTLR